MARFRREHPELMRAQMDLDAERDAMEKMQASSSREEPGPSGTINVSSDSEESCPLRRRVVSDRVCTCSTLSSLSSVLCSSLA